MLFDRLLKLTEANLLCRSEVQYVRALFLFACVCYTVLSLISAGYIPPSRVRTSQEMAECLMHYAFLFCNSYYLITWRKKSHIRSLITDALNLHVYSDDDQLERLHGELVDRGRLRSRFVRISLFIYGSLLTLACTPLLVASLLFQSKSSGGYEQLFLIRLWKPADWNIDDSFFVFVFVCSLQTVTIVFTNVGMFSVLCLYYFQTEVCRRETDSLIELLARIDNLVTERTSNCQRYGSHYYYHRERRNRAKDRVYYRLIGRCYQHHRSIYRYTRKLLSVYKPIMMALVAVNFLCAVTFICIVAEPKQALVRRTVWIACLAMVGTFLFFICYSGENYVCINGRYRNALYQTGWSDRSLAVQKSVLLQLTVMNFEMRMSVSSGLYLSCVFYTYLLRKAYAVVNFLLNVKN